MNNKLFVDMEFTGLYKDTRIISLAITDGFGNKFYAFDESVSIPETLRAEDRKFLEKIREVAFSPHILHDISADDRRIVFDNGRDLINICRMYTIESHPHEGRVNLGNSILEFVEILQGKDYHTSDPFTIVLDVGHYDWVLFCDIFSGARNLPKVFNYIPLDLATMLHEVDHIRDSDASRKDLFISAINNDNYESLFFDDIEHHALLDAIMIREIYRDIIYSKRS